MIQKTIKKFFTRFHIINQEQQFQWEIWPDISEYGIAILMSLFRRSILMNPYLRKTLYQPLSRR